MQTKIQEYIIYIYFSLQCNNTYLHRSYTPSEQRTQSRLWTPDVKDRTTGSSGSKKGRGKAASRNGDTFKNPTN